MPAPKQDRCAWALIPGTNSGRCIFAQGHAGEHVPLNAGVTMPAPITRERCRRIVDFPGGGSGVCLLYADHDGECR